MRQKAALVSLNFYRTSPLACGYLHAYALKDEAVAAAWTFEYYTRVVAESQDQQLLTDLLALDADLYCFSCYAWNMGMLRRVLAGLLAARPDVHIILGGPHVMHCASLYLSPAHERMVLCNGEGERTFQNYLRALLSPQPDLSAVRGLSFYRDGQLITTPQEDRIRDLDEIPSPYLTGLIDPRQWDVLLLETNRGCPYSCTFCYWGGAIGSKVNRLGEDRVKTEIEFLAQHHIDVLYIIDANWGMSQRDVDLSRHVVECKQKYGSPAGLSFSTAKNSQERVIEIVKMLHEANMAVSQNISLQTMNPEALAKAGRKNIKKESYISIQRTLNDLALASQIELIWPLPGETLTSFREGIRELFLAGANGFLIYDLQLLNNVEMLKQKAAYGIVAVPAVDPNVEVEVVVGTNEVSHADWLTGKWLAASICALFNQRLLAALPAYLERAGILSFDAFFMQMADFIQANRAQSFWGLIAKATEVLDSQDEVTRSEVMHCMLHSHRIETAYALRDHLATQAWWHDETAQLMFEIDLLNRPYLYSNSVFGLEADLIRQVQVESITQDGYQVRLPEAALDLIRGVLGNRATFTSSRTFVNHRRGQHQAITSTTPVSEYLAYCVELTYSLGSLYPSWSDAAATKTAPRRTPGNAPQSEARRSLPMVP